MRDPYGHDPVFMRKVEERQEIARREKEYLAQQEQRGQQREREKKQADLEAHLRARGERYTDLAGEVPSATLLRTWRDEYAAQREKEREADLERRRAAAWQNAY